MVVVMAMMVGWLLPSKNCIGMDGGAGAMLWAFAVLRCLETKLVFIFCG
jgi:hypothetical protein